ncbi:MAG: hypothetical protein K2H89_02035 [Oscillospiraceae bacterium]|nr:hypothetical protein [Oscillospiraceae bacterium]
MRNLLKAIHYQMRHDLFVIILFLIAGIISGIIIISDVNFSSVTGSEFLAAFGMAYPILFMILISMLTTRICGWDFMDKTLNYEILAGHTRNQVYWAKVCASLLWCLTSCIIFTVLPVLVVTIIYGWEASIDPGSAVLCFVLAIFPMIQFISEIVLLTFLLKNYLIAAVISCMLGEFVMMINIIMTSLGYQSMLFLALPNLIALFDFSNYHMGYVNGEDVMVIDMALTMPVILTTILSSVLIGAACLVIGSVVFRKSDLR